MREFWEELFCSQLKEISNLESLSKLGNEIEMNKKCLKINLSKKQKKLLLRIEDAKNLITEESNLDSFIAGFKIGLRIGYESNKE